MPVRVTGSLPSVIALFALECLIVTPLAFAQDEPQDPAGEQAVGDEEVEDVGGSEASSLEAVDPRLHAVEMSRAAQDAYAEGDIARAIVLFEQAFDYAPDPAFAMNLAQLYDAEGQLPQALEYYEAYLTLFDVAPDRDEILQIIEEIQGELDEGWSLVTVISVPNEATVSVVYGEEVFYLGLTPYTRYLEPEIQLFRLELDGYEVMDQPILPVAGEPVDYSVVLIPLPEPERPPVNHRLRTGYYLLGGGVALAVGGVALWSSSDEGSTGQTAGLVAGGLGGAALVGGLVLVALGDPDEPTAELSLSPAFVGSRGQLGGALSLRF